MDSVATSSPAPLKNERKQDIREARTQRNQEVSENQARTALVLGGGAPNMALMAGALAAFADRKITFDVVSTSGAGSLAGLLWLAPKGNEPRDALESVTAMSVTDKIYEVLPVNYKVFNKPGPWADMWRHALAANPFFRLDAKSYKTDPLYALGMDWVGLMGAMMTPSGVQSDSWGLCAPAPFAEAIVDFDKLADVAPYFYLNAYNVTKETIVNFRKEEITPDHFRAALAFPFIYGPYKMGEEYFYEGAVVDCLNFKDLVEMHTGLDTIVVFDVLGSDKLIRNPRNLYDSWVLSMIVPLVKTAEDNFELFALKHNHGYRRQEGAKTDLLRVEFDVPDGDLDKVLDWSSSNATRLFKIGYEAGLNFADAHGAALAARQGSSRDAHA